MLHDIEFFATCIKIVLLGELVHIFTETHSFLLTKHFKFLLINLLPQRTWDFYKIQSNS